MVRRFLEGGLLMILTLTLSPPSRGGDKVAPKLPTPPWMLVPTLSGPRSAVLREDGSSLQAAEEGIGYYGTVKSLPPTRPCGRNEPPRRTKRPVGTTCPDWPSECRERLDSNQRPPEPHSRSAEGEFLGKYVPFASCG